MDVEEKLRFVISTLVLINCFSLWYFGYYKNRNTKVAKLWVPSPFIKYDFKISENMTFRRNNPNDYEDPFHTSFVQIEVHYKKV